MFFRCRHPYKMLRYAPPTAEGIEMDIMTREKEMFV